MNRIFFDENNKIFKLDTNSTSYIMSVVDEEGFLAHVYYGAKISDVNLNYLLKTDENPFVPTVNNRDRYVFLDSFPKEFPGNNVGDYRESAITIKDVNGNFSIQPLYKSHKIYNGKPALQGLPATFGKDEECQTLEIVLEDKVCHVEMTLLYSVFCDTDAIARSVIVKNCGENSIFLEKIMSLSVDMPDEEYRMINLHGAWARERHIEYRQIGYGIQGVKSTKGETSHQDHPFIGLVGKNTSQESGDVYGFNFVYSGNFIAQVEKDQNDSLRVSMGIHPDNFCFKLASGEEFVAPEAIMIYSDGGIGKMTRGFHDLYRRHLIRSPYKDKKRPILINNWEATYFDFDTDKLLSIAREAKKSGIEMLVMDDGWFGYRNDDNTSLGDWIVNEDKLKGGLKHLVDRVNEIGLKFGIWMEPEMVSPDSDLYRAHPDWIIRVPDREPCRGRNQYVLDIGRPEVADYAYNCVANILKSANIEYVKWDMNRTLTDIGSAALDPERQGEVLHRYVLALYAIQERLVQEFPNLLLENCSAGGARFDPGMLFYSPQIWCSDDTDAIERLTIQEGTALIYPLSTMGAHVSDCPNHTVGRTTPFETRGHVALAGTFGYELDITRIPEEDLKTVPQQVELYHRYNDLIREGDYYRIASYSENKLYDCYAVVSKDKSEALITYVQVMGQPNVRSRKIKLAGLDKDAVYKIEGRDYELSGEAIEKAGILVAPKSGDYRSELIYICKK